MVWVLHLLELRDGQLATLARAPRRGSRSCRRRAAAPRAGAARPVVGEPQASGRCARQIADAVGVLAGVVVVQLGGRGEPREHLELRLLELPRGAAGVGDVLDLGEELRDRAARRRGSR